VSLREYPDGMDVAGGPISGGRVDGAGDHRCAMSFCVLGQVAAAAVTVSGCENIDTSYPGFVEDLLSVGGRVAAESRAGKDSAARRPPTTASHSGT